MSGPFVIHGAAGVAASKNGPETFVAGRDLRARQAIASVMLTIRPAKGC